MAVIYQQYRPQKFSDVVGQEHIKTTLAKEVADDSLAHAYLFVGPRGTGKTTVARILARAINCEKRKKSDAEPCNTCGVCTQMLKGQYLDLIEIDAATHTQVDNVRDVIIASARVPALKTGTYKIFIIDEVHMLSKHAFNALLKTIEEPPARVIFVLATTDVHKVPGTIISRCERYDFKKIPHDLIVKRLSAIAEDQGVSVPEATVHTIARTSEGCLRDAESLFGQVLSLAEKGSVAPEDAERIIPSSNWLKVGELITLLATRNLPGSLQYVHGMVSDGVSMDLFMTDAIEYLRHLVMRQAIGEQYNPDIDEASRTTLAQLSATLSSRDARILLELFLRETQRLSLTSISQLPLELLCVTFCSEGAAVPTSHRAQESSPTPSPASSPERMQELNALWPQLLDNLKGYNHSLAVFLKSSHPLAHDGATVTIGCKYDFHARTMLEHKNKTTIEKTLSALLHATVHIDCIVDPQYTNNHKNFNGGSEPEVQDILNVMGGEIV